MQAYDLFMLIVLVAATVWGLWKGLAWQLASMGSILLSYLVAFRFRQAVAEHLNATPPWNIFLAMLILFLVTSLLVWIAFRFVRAFIDRLKLREFDHQIGGIFGAAKGVVLCAIITLFAVTLLGESQQQMIIESRSGKYIAQLLDSAHPVIHPIMPKEIHDVLYPHLHKLDQTLDSSHDHDHHDGHEHQEGTDGLDQTLDSSHGHDHQEGTDGTDRVEPIRHATEPLGDRPF